MDDGRIQKVVLMQLRDRASKNRCDATLRLPSAKDAINPRVVNFRPTRLILLDRQFLPRTADVKQVQNVVEDRMRGEL